MGRNWKLLKIDEQGRVSDLIKQLIVKAYDEGLNGKARPVVSYGEVIQVSEKRLEVPSRLCWGIKTFNLLYRLGRLKSGWQFMPLLPRISVSFPTIGSNLMITFEKRMVLN